PCLVPPEVAGVSPGVVGRWRNENYERPVDLEGSGDDDPFGEDELDDIYSGSGSGCEYLGGSWGRPWLAVGLGSSWEGPWLAVGLEGSREGSLADFVLSLRYNFSDTGRGHPNVTPMSPTLSPASDILPVDTLWSLSPAPSCPFPQMEPGEVTTVPDSELEVPASSGPSGDFEIREEEETTRPDLRNEVVAVVTPPAGPGPGRNVETGLMDNTIDSGNSAAQLPQKNILERKEVLIAVIVGGVVGALFAAFLVMLLIYRMKKKDEGSYTLEEPKQANVTYQKPDKQEEFYA
uniref:Syndecan n=1 Tax=Zosterops lateralis melanops TaxID=1220523 RepID=A0A8D2PJW4_ZOSLA